MRPYTDIPALAEVVLEESFVLRVSATPGALEVEAELFLTVAHPRYAPPEAGENGRYELATIAFDGVTALWWRGQGAPPAFDASGEADYGHIDRFSWDTGRYAFEFDGGLIDVEARGLRVTPVPPPTAS